MTAPCRKTKRWPGISPSGAPDALKIYVPSCASSRQYLELSWSSPKWLHARASAFCLQSVLLMAIRSMVRTSATQRLRQYERGCCHVATKLDSNRICETLQAMFDGLFLD